MPIAIEVQNLIARSQDASRVSDPARAQRIALYASGLESKLKEASFALSQIRILSASMPQSGYDSLGYNDFDRMHFYSDSFWAFERSALDVVAQLINQTEDLGLQEDGCDFRRLISEMENRHPAAPLTASLNNLRNTARIAELNDYRNCSLHRRQVFLQYQQSSKAIVYSTPGYGTSGTGSVVSHEWYVCDNPLDVTPTVGTNRLLPDYCKAVFDDIENQLTTIITSLLP
jgi:hypothetical protein